MRVRCLLPAALAGACLLATASPAAAEGHRQAGAGYQVQVLQTQDENLRGAAPEVFYRQTIGERWVLGSQLFHLEAEVKQGHSDDAPNFTYSRTGYLASFGRLFPVGAWTLLPQGLLGVAQDSVQVKPGIAASVSDLDYQGNTRLYGAAGTVQRPVWRPVFAGLKLMWLEAHTELTRVSGSSSGVDGEGATERSELAVQNTLAVVLDVGVRF